MRESIDSLGRLVNHYLIQVAHVRYTRPVMGKHGGRKGFDLGEEGGLPAQRMPGDGRGLDPRAE